MNHKYDEIMKIESLTRRKSHYLIEDGTLNKKDWLWIRKNHILIKYDNLKFLDEDLYLNIPFPLKQQK